jgi:coenzyme Q-binding protein COQ10
MPTFRSTRQVKHSAADMFALVADVERYPEFVPLCESLRVVRRAQSGEGIETIVAAMSVGYKAIQESFTSRVELDHPRLRIDVEYVDGPFKYLENRWTFRDTSDGSEVGFYINYEFKSFALGLLMGAVFDKAFRKFAEAFEERADFVYFGRRADAAGGVG